MAVIGTIRKRSGLLIFLIGVAIVGFLVMDVSQSQSSMLRGRKDSVGEVDGEKISIFDFNKKYDENVKNMETQMKSSLGEEQRNMLRNQTWNDMVSDAIFNKVYEKLGIGVTMEETNDLFMSPTNAAPEIQQQFRNPQTGQFDPSQVRLYMSQLDQERQDMEPGAQRRQWLAFEAYMKKSQHQRKYDNLIAKALFVPTWQAEMGYNDQQRLVDFAYVQVPYTDVNDADLKITDEDLKKYIDDHKSQFIQEEETRKLEYVTFDVNPSAADSAKVILSLEEKREEFAKGATASDDSVFVKIYSETPFEDIYLDKDKIFSPIKDSLFQVPVKTVIGPYLDGKSYKLAKVSDRKMISDSVHVREIVISFNNATTQEAFNARFKQLDSIYRQIDSLKGDFGLFAFTFSDDATSKMRGGDIGWVKQGEKEKYYNDLIFYHSQKGKIYKVPVQAENAIHLVQVVEDRPSKMGVEVAYLSTEIIPSEETEKNIYSTASSFAADNQTEAKFKEAAKKQGVKTAMGVKKEDFSVQGIGSARELVKWAFGAKKGEVSAIFPLGNKHVVAMLVEVQPKGVQELDAVREQVKAEVTKKKKFEILSKKINEAKSASISDLAAKLGKQPAQADKLSILNPNLNGMTEPAVVATALNTAAGKLSPAIEGYTGVFVVQTIAIQEPTKTTDYSVAVMQLKQQLQAKSRYAQDVQRKLANVDDYRSDFF